MTRKRVRLPPVAGGTGRIFAFFFPPAAAFSGHRPLSLCLGGMCVVLAPGGTARRPQPRARPAHAAHQVLGALADRGLVRRLKCEAGARMQEGFIVVLAGIKHVLPAAPRLAYKLHSGSQVHLHVG